MNDDHEDDEDDDDDDDHADEDVCELSIVAHPTCNPCCKHPLLNPDLGSLSSLVAMHPATFHGSSALLPASRAPEDRDSTKRRTTT